MLLPSSKRIEALLGSASVEVELWQGLKTPRRTHACEPASEAPFFESMLASVEMLGRALDSLATEGASLKGARLNLVIADHWLLYDIVDIDLRDLPTRASGPAVTATLADLADTAPSSLVTRWQTVDGATRQVACAMPADALAALNQLVRRHRLRWGRAQGEFVVAFNEHRSELDAPAAALAVMRPQGTQIGIVAHGVLAALHHETGHPTSDRLAMLSDSLLRRAGHAPDPSMRYLADARQVDLGAPWCQLAPAPQVSLS